MVDLIELGLGCFAALQKKTFNPGLLVRRHTSIFPFFSNVSWARADHECRLDGSSTFPFPHPPSPSMPLSTIHSVKDPSSSSSVNSLCCTLTRNKSLSDSSATRTLVNPASSTHSKRKKYAPSRLSPVKPKYGSTSRSCAGSTSLTAPVSCPSPPRIPTRTRS